MNHLFLLCFLILNLPLLLPAQNWPQFRGFQGHGIVKGNEQVPLEWDSEKNIQWKTELGGKGSSSPIIWGDKIFVTAFSGYGHSEANPGNPDDLVRHLICIDKANGKILWKTSLPKEKREGPYQRFMAHHGYTSVTPVTDGKAIYVYFGKDGALAYDFEGNLLWRFTDVGRWDGNGFGSGGGVTLFEDLIIINSSPESNAIIGLDKATGKEIWRTNDVVQSFHTPTLFGKELIVAARDQLLGLNPATGDQLWKGYSPPSYVCNSPTVFEGTAYITHGRGRTTIALGPNGKELWSAPMRTVVSSPAYANGRIYVLNTNVLGCYEAKTGQEVFKSRVGLPLADNHYSSPLTIGDRIYFVTRQEGTVVFEAGEEMKILAYNKIAGDDSFFNATPAVSDGKLYLRSEKFLYCIAE